MPCILNGMLCGEPKPVCSHGAAYAARPPDVVDPTTMTLYEATLWEARNQLGLPVKELSNGADSPLTWWEIHLRYAQLIYTQKMLLDPQNHPATGPLQGGLVVVGVGGIAEIGGVLAGLAGAGVLLAGGVTVGIEGTIWTIDQIVAGESPDLLANYGAPMAIVIGIRGLGWSASKITKGMTSSGTVSPELGAELDDVIPEAIAAVRDAKPRAATPTPAASADAPSTPLSATGPRPRAKPKGGLTAEREIEKNLNSQFQDGRMKDLKTQQSWFENDPSSHGVKGSTRPDFTIVNVDDVAVYAELKSYERVWSADLKKRRAGISDLVRAVVKQVEARDLQIGNAGARTEQAIIVDLRAGRREYGPEVAREVIREIARRLGTQSDNRILPGHVYPWL